MSRGNLPIVVRLEDRLRERLLEEVASVNRRRPKLEYSISSFVREAIVEKLGHKERSKKSRDKKKYLCRCCKQKKAIEEIASSMKLLTGETEYTCSTCEFAFASNVFPPN